MSRGNIRMRSGILLRGEFLFADVPNPHINHSVSRVEVCFHLGVCIDVKMLAWLCALVFVEQKSLIKQGSSDHRQEVRKRSIVCKQALLCPSLNIMVLAPCISRLPLIPLCATQPCLPISSFHNMLTNVPPFHFFPQQAPCASTEMARACMDGTRGLSHLSPLLQLLLPLPLAPPLLQLLRPRPRLPRLPLPTSLLPALPVPPVLPALLFPLLRRLLPARPPLRLCLPRKEAKSLLLRLLSAAPSAPFASRSCRRRPPCLLRASAPRLWRALGEKAAPMSFASRVWDSTAA